MSLNLEWLPSAEVMDLEGNPLSGIYVTQTGDRSWAPGFAFDINLPVEYGPPEPFSDEQSIFAFREWTPAQRGEFVRWWSAGHPAREPDQLAEAFCMMAFANMEMRLMGGRKDGYASELLCKLQQAHQSIFTKRGLSPKLNRLLQLSVYQQGKERHIELINRLLSMNGIVWGTTEINLMSTGLLFAGTPMDARAALMACWAASTPEEQNAAIVDWPSFVEKFSFEFRSRFPSDLRLHRPAKSIPVVYVPTHPDTTHVVTPDALREVEVPDFYADGQFDLVQQLFRSLIVQKERLVSGGSFIDMP